jgi:hypothetical protein
VVLLWPFFKMTPTSGLDPSWNAALAMATHKHLALGTHPFVYGPLGVFQVPALWYRGTSAASQIFWLFFDGGVLGGLLWALRRSLPFWVALVITYVAGGLALRAQEGAECALGVVAAWCISLLVGELSARWSRWWWAALWAIAAVLFLFKRDVGSVLGVMLLLSMCLAPESLASRLSWGAGGIGIFAAVFGAGWLVTGNTLGSVPGYLEATVELFEGYASAMSSEVRPVSDLIQVGLVCGLLAVLIFTDRRAHDVRSRVGILLVVGGSTWAVVREEFVRHDTHAYTFFAFAVLLVAGFQPGRRPMLPLLLSLTTVCTMLVVVVGAAPVIGLDPLAGPIAAYRQVGPLFSAQKASAVDAAARRRMQRTYALPRPIVELTAGVSVDIDPWEQAVAWAYPTMRWDPLPVLQDYSAYTTWLDDQDVADVDSSKAPTDILRQGPESVDNRDPFQDPPGTQLAILCNYQQVAVTTGWQLLTHSPNRCSAPRLVSTVSVPLGKTIRVPQTQGADAAENMIVASFSPAPLSPTEELQGLLMKPPVEHLVLNGTTYRYLPGTGSDLHLLGAPGDLGWSAAFSPPKIHSLSLTVDGERPGTPGLEVTFWEITVR